MPQETHNFDGLVGELDVVDDILLLLLIKIQILIPYSLRSQVPRMTVPLLCRQTRQKGQRKKTRPLSSSKFLVSYSKYQPKNRRVYFIFPMSEFKFYAFVED